MSTLTAIQRSPLGRATIGDQLRRHARTLRDKPAFVAYDAQGLRSVISYASLNEQANRFANALTELGVVRGDRVAVMSRNRIDTVVAYYGALKIGAAFSGVSQLFRAAEIRQQVAHLEPAVLVVAGEFRQTAEEALSGLGVRVLIDFDAESTESPPDDNWLGFQDLLRGASAAEPETEVDEHDLAMVVYTSGTEAAPKGVMISHRNYLISTTPAYTWGLRCLQDDVWLFVMPFHTIAGIGSMTSLTLLGATLILPATTEAGTSLQMIRDEGISVIAQTPTFYIALSQHPAFSAETVGSIERCLTYGGQVSPHAVAAWAQAAPKAIWGTYWGQSELTQLGSVGWFKKLEDIPDADPTWIGRPVGHLETMVVDADGQEAEIGELWCRTPSVMAGYLKDPERTAAVLADGWVHTGDIVRQDAAGNLFFLDRSKDMIKTGGLNVSSQEVERVLQSHPDVVRAAVVGLPDPYWSEAVTGFVVIREGAETTAEQLRVHCHDLMAAFKTPKEIHLMDELPTDAQGKLLKRELRRVHGAGS